MEITDKLERICKASSHYQLISTRKTDMWHAFHRIWVEELPKMWKELFRVLHMDVEDQFLEQCVNQKMFEMTIPHHIVSCTANKSSITESGSVELTGDELNVLQIVGGFVPHSLLKRFKKGGKYTEYLECLSDMGVPGENDSNILDYTREWMEKINRGGLFPFKNITFQLFTAIETVSRNILPAHLNSRAGNSFSDAIDSVSSSDEVQWHWTLLSQSLESLEDAEWLLKENVKLFVTIRGFSIAWNWMELYKLKEKKSTRKSTGLRKQLS